MPVDEDLTRAVARIVRGQHGAIAAEQLRAAGMTRHAILARVKRGSLVALFRGVYIAGDPDLIDLARESAALPSLGSTAVLSHRSAAAVWGLAQLDPSMIDVTIAGSNPRPRPGVRLHRVQRIDPRDIASESNLRLTSPARTLIDFAGQASSSELAHGPTRS